MIALVSSDDTAFRAFCRHEQALPANVQIPVISMLRIAPRIGPSIGERSMKQRLRFPWALAVMFFVSAGAWAQERAYPITLVPPGKGPYEFPSGYQPPWDKI